MLPYLAAVGLVVSADVSSAATVGLLAAYCLVMLLPALVLLGLRRVAARRVDPLLARLERLSARGTDTTLWIAFFVGAFVAGDAADGLRLLGG